MSRDTNERSTRIRPRVRDAVLQSLRAGVVPRTGLQHIQVGRKSEVEALLRDVERVADGGSAFRLVIGEYGSGKTFFLNLVRSIALEQRLVTAHGDLSPDRRLHATGGQARSLYRELMRNLSTRSRNDGGALPAVVERFVATARARAREEGVGTESIIRERLEQLQEMVGGYDFAEVIAGYWRGHDLGDEELKSNAVRWLRAEFSTKTDARKALGVRTIIDDGQVYDHLKLFARFVRLAGYEGLLVCVDEVVNLYKLASGRARKSNYEQLLRILNDSLQGNAVGLGVLFGGTPELLYDTRRGLYSYDALQTRLATNSFATGDLVDHTGPVLQLDNLSPEDLFVLLGRIRHVQAAGDPGAYLLPDDGLKAFLRHCSEHVGDAYFRTPRNSVKAFVNLLAVLEQNPGTDWRDLVGRVSVTEDHGAAEELEMQDESGGDNADDGHDDLASFRL